MIQYELNPQDGGRVEVDLYKSFPEDIFLEVFMGQRAAVVILTPQEAEQLSVRLWEASVKAAQV